MSTFEIKAGDAGRVIAESLWADTAPYNLATSTVRLVAKRASTGVATSIAATVLVAATGRVSAVVDTLLTIPDLFSLEWEVTDGAAILTFKSKGYEYLVVTADND